MTLDDALEAWAVAIRLPDATAEGIYRQIVGTPVAAAEPVPGLDARWWRQFSADFAAGMIASTTPAAWAA